MNEKPADSPACAFFSSGPCKKIPGWSISDLSSAFLGRSHRSAGGKAKLKDAIDKTKTLLQLPMDYRVAIVPASDTGAVEMALWSLLGSRPVDVFSWESFSSDWVRDIIKELKLPDVRHFDAEYGKIPDLAQADFNHDVVFAWNGTTSGVRVPNADWIDSYREGLVICDATSAVFAQEIEWERLDVVTFSWQKVLGGEAAHGMLILSPRAVERLEAYQPAWPIPKIFRMTSGGKINEKLFQGDTINTPSMLCVEDYLKCLEWVDSIGGQNATIARCDSNAAILSDWVARTDWIEHLVEQPDLRSNTSVCLKIVDPLFLQQSPEQKVVICKKLVQCLAQEGVAYDIASYRAAPTGLRIWCGATIDQQDIEKLCPWLEWAWQNVKTEMNSHNCAA